MQITSCWITIYSKELPPASFKKLQYRIVLSFYQFVLFEPVWIFTIHFRQAKTVSSLLKTEPTSFLKSSEEKKITENSVSSYSSYQHYSFD